jgi:hypothetical protein
MAINFAGLVDTDNGLVSRQHLHGELTRKVEHFRYRKAPLLDEHRFQDG